VKVGRNDPCPCGSGKKYKKCCMNKEKSTERINPTQNTKALKEQLERMPTSQLIGNIKKAGVKLDENLFIEEINLLGSANKMLQSWAKQLNVDVEQLPPAFYMSIQILVSRLAPKAVLLEELQNLMEDGYRLADPDQIEDKLFIWWKLWKDLQEWIDDQQLTSIEEVDAVTESVLRHTVSDWLTDFNKVLEEASEQNNTFISMRHVFADDFLSRFPNAPEQLTEEIFLAREEAAYH